MSAVFQTSFTGAKLAAAPKSVRNGLPTCSSKVVAMAGTKKVRHFNDQDVVNTINERIAPKPVGFRKTDLNFLCILFLFLKYADEQL
jgi:hypothetical protein